MTDGAASKRRSRWKIAGAVVAAAAVVGAGVFWWVLTPPPIDNAGRTLPETADPDPALDRITL